MFILIGTTKCNQSDQNLSFNATGQLDHVSKLTKYLFEHLENKTEDNKGDVCQLRFSDNFANNFTVNCNC